MRVLQNQHIQVDMYNGFRIRRVSSVSDIELIDGVQYGYANLFNLGRRRVRQSRHSQEWYFVDEDGNRLNQQFGQLNRELKQSKSRSY